MNAGELLAEAERAAEDNPLIECEELERPSADTQPTAGALHEETEAVRHEGESIAPEDHGPLENTYTSWTGSGRVILTKRPLSNGLQLNARCGKICSKNWGPFQTTLKFTRSSAVSLKSLTTPAF